MSRFIALAVGMVFAAGFPQLAAAKVTVVTTTQDPAALTRVVGGDRVEVTALAKGYQDPHFLEAKPSYMVLLHKAELVEVIGLDLEVGYIGALLSGARNQAIMPGKPGYLDLSQSVKPLEVLSAVDRAQGDIHPNGNPHYWLDPENGRLMARAISARLTAIDPVPAGSGAVGPALLGKRKKLTSTPDVVMLVGGQKEQLWTSPLFGTLHLRMELGT